MYDNRKFHTRKRGVSKVNLRQIIHYHFPLRKRKSKPWLVEKMSVAGIVLAKTQTPLFFSFSLWLVEKMSVAGIVLAKTQTLLFFSFSLWLVEKMSEFQ